MTREEVREHKPHPEIYLKTAERLGVHNTECMVFEDTALGVRAAIEAGMQCSVILNGMNNRSDMEGLPIAAFISERNELNRLYNNIVFE